MLAGLATVAVVLVVTAWAITSTTRDHLIAQIDDRLITASDPGREGRFGGTEPPPPPVDDVVDVVDVVAPPERLSDMFEGIARPSGDLVVIFRSNIPDQEYSEPDVGWDDVSARVGDPFTVDAVDGEVRYRVVASPLDTDIFVRALPLADVDDTINRLILFEILGVTIVLAVLAAVAWWVVHLGIRPVRRMTDTATEIAEGDLSIRVPEPAPSGTEAGALARALNTMLGRIETAVDRQARSEERLRRFVADASHELRTPVTTIRGYAELYRRGGLDDAGELDDAMRRTQQEAERMGRLVEDMLTLAQLDRERPLEHASVDLGSAIADTVADATVSAPDHHIEAEIDCDLVVRGDEDRLRQVLVNIVGNAVVHTPAGTNISVAAHCKGHDVVVEVRDDGPGMEADAAARVTERFYRVDRARSRERGGSGLGLSIADAVVGAHRGALDVTSRPGEGTTVTLTLPTADA